MGGVEVNLVGKVDFNGMNIVGFIMAVDVCVWWSLVNDRKTMATVLGMYH